MREKSREKTALSTVKKRMAALIGAVFLLFMALVVRIAVVSIVNHEKYSDLAISQQLRDTIITPKRGTVYDRNMNVLAESAACWTVALSPNDIDEEDYGTVATGLSEILGVDYDTVFAKCDENNYYSVIKRKVDEVDVDRVRAFMSEQKLGGVQFTEDSKRYYPYGNFAAHLLGFVGTDNYGLAGIEAYYNSYLSGTSGRMITAQNAVGTEMYYESKTVYDAKEGYSLVLTLDEVIQHYLESALETAVKEHNVKNRASGIVMNVNTGEILAMATKGDFDPNDPFSVVDTATLERLELIRMGGDGSIEAAERYVSGMTATEREEWDQMSAEDKYLKAYGIEQQEQWNNKAINEIYEPGSVFKTITAAIALETNTCTEHSTFYCGGSIQVADYTMSCALTAHGWQTFGECLIHSCNPGFIQIGQAVGRQQFYSYFKNFGLTQYTGIDLPGEAPSVFYREDELNIVELSSASYGQSNAITPIQMITAFSAVVNGGYLVQPHVVSQVLDSEGTVVETAGNPVKRQVISEETSNEIALILEQIIDPSNGSRSNTYVAGYRIGGKSGTSQKLASDDDRAFVASFCAFAPVDDPEIAVLILLDEASSYSIYGTTLVGPIIANVMANVLPYIGIDPAYTEEELVNDKQGVPNVVSLSLTQAYSAMQNRGLNYVVVGDGVTIQHQHPAGGFAVPRGATVYLYTDPEYVERMTTVPGLIGYDAESVEFLLRNAGLNLEINGNGNGYAVTQGLEEGEEVAAGTIVTVTFVDQSLND